MKTFPPLVPVGGDVLTLKRVNILRWEDDLGSPNPVRGEGKERMKGGTVLVGYKAGQG